MPSSRGAPPSQNSTASVPGGRRGKVGRVGRVVKAATWADEFAGSKCPMCKVPCPFRLPRACPARV